MNTHVCPGEFLGGDIEPGTFHAMVDPRDQGDRDTVTEGADDVAPAEHES